MLRHDLHKLLLVLILSLICTVAAAAETETDYLAIMMMGQKIGYAANTRTVEGSHVITTEEFSMTLGRGGQAVTAHSREMYIETTDGKPLSFEISMNISGVEQKTSGTIEKGKVNLVRQDIGAPRESVIDWPADALMPEGMRLQQMQKGLEPGTRYEMTLFRPDMMMSIKTDIIIGQKQKVDLFGRVLELTEVKQISKVQNQPITITSYVDDDYKALKSTSPVMGMTLEFLACSEAFAMQENNVIDFLSKFSIKSPVQLLNLGSAESIVYEIKPINGQTISLPETAHQKVRSGNDGLVVTVQRLSAPQNIKLPYDGTDPNILEYCKPTDMLQSDNTEIIDLARHAVGGTEDAAKAAKQIESFVAGYIQKKDLSVGYASAAEVAQSRQGDCSEHALLTAAMCRAVGIPARVVCGVLYVDSFANHKNIFGGHMWAEAYLGDKWYGLDATSIDQDNVNFGFGPGHIALAVGNGSPVDFFNLVNTLGCFTIENITVYRIETENTETAQVP